MLRGNDSTFVPDLRKEKKRKEMRRNEKKRKGKSGKASGI